MSSWIGRSNVEGLDGRMLIFSHERMAVEGDFLCRLLPFPVRLDVEALVNVLGTAVLPIDREPFEVVVGVLDLNGVGASAIACRLPLDNGVVVFALALDCDGGVCRPTK